MKFEKLMKQTLHIVIWRVFLSWVQCARRVTSRHRFWHQNISSWIFLSNYWKKNCTLWFDEFLLSMQCAARLVQFWRQKDKNDGSASDFRKNPHFIEETRRFFSQSHHDPQGSRLKIFPGLAFGGLPTFFARANIQSICTTTRSKPVFSRNIS